MENINNQPINNQPIKVNEILETLVSRINALENNQNNQPSRNSREPKVPLPEKFGGERKKLRGFLNQLVLFSPIRLWLGSLRILNILKITGSFWQTTPNSRSCWKRLLAHTTVLFWPHQRSKNSDKVQNRSPSSLLNFVCWQVTWLGTMMHWLVNFVKG